MGCFGSCTAKTRPLPLDNSYQLKGQTKSQSFPILKQGFIQRLYLSQHNTYNKKISVEQFIVFFSHTQYPKYTLQHLFNLFEKQDQNQMGILQLQNGMEALVYETDEELIKIMFWLYSDDAFKKVISAGKIKVLQLQNADCFRPNSPVIQQTSNENKSSGFYPYNNFLIWMRQCFISQPFRQRIINKKITQMQRLIITYHNEIQHSEKNGQKSQKYEYIISSKWWESLKLYILARYQARVQNNQHQQNKKLEAGRLSTILANIPSNIIFLVKSEDQKINLGIVGKFECKAGIDNRRLSGTYQAELVNHISYGLDYITINPKLYSLLFTLYGGGPQFKRQAKKGSLQLYPLFIRQFLFQNFEIIDETFAFIQYSKFDKFSQIEKHYRGNIFYYKQFAGSAWKKLNHSSDKYLYQLDLQSNCFLINMDQVNQKFFLRTNDETRKQQLQNPSYGDVYLTKSIIQKKKLCVIRITRTQVILHSLSQLGIRQYLCSIQQAPNILQLCDSPIISTRTYNGLIHTENSDYSNSVIVALFFPPFLSMKFMAQSMFQSPLLKQINQLVLAHLNSQISNAKQLKSIIHSKSLTTGQQHLDSYKFMLDLIKKCQKQQQSEKNPKYLTKTLNGKIKTQHQCMTCSFLNQINESFKILSIPIPEQKNNIYSINLRRCSAHKKFQVKLQRNATLFDLHEAFQKVSLLKRQQYQLFQIEQNDVYRHLYLYQKQLTLKQINLKPEDRICAYLKSTKNYQITLPSNKYGSLKLPQQQVICQILGTSSNTCKVSYRDFNGVFYNRIVDVNKISQFPNSQKQRSLWIKVLNRDYFDLQPNSDPTMIHIPDWCNMAELQNTIFKKYQKANQKQGAFILRYLDSQFRCIVCHKYIKGMINQKQKQFIGIFCKGKCNVNPLLPILSFAGLTVAIDWTDLESFNKFRESASNQSLQQNPKISIQSCLKDYFSIKYLQKYCQKCSKNTKHLQVKKMSNQPQLLIVHLQRFIKQQQKNSRKIKSRLRFNDDLQIKGVERGLYQLSSIVCHSGNVNQGRFYSIVKQNNSWNVYNQQTSTVEQFINIDQKSVYILLYELVN